MTLTLDQGHYDHWTDYFLIDYRPPPPSTINPVGHIRAERIRCGLAQVSGGYHHTHFQRFPLHKIPENANMKGFFFFLIEAGYASLILPRYILKLIKAYMVAPLVEK